MEVVVVSPTIQEFDGVRYYLCGKYFQNDGKRLHVAVWTAHNGRSPRKGFHVHHVDEDRSNNQNENLEEKQHAKHISDHFKGKHREFPTGALDAAAEWHKSEAGHQWHLEHYAKNGWNLHREVDLICGYCGVAFVGVPRPNRFCSNACKSAFRRRAGLDDEKRKCIICSKEFVASRFRKTVTCSRACRGMMQRGITKSRKTEENRAESREKPPV